MFTMHLLKKQQYLKLHGPNSWLFSPGHALTVNRVMIPELFSSQPTSATKMSSSSQPRRVSVRVTSSPVRQSMELWDSCILTDSVILKCSLAFCTVYKFCIDTRTIIDPHPLPSPTLFNYFTHRRKTKFASILKKLSRSYHHVHDINLKINYACGCKNLNFLLK